MLSSLPMKGSVAPLFLTRSPLGKLPVSPPSNRVMRLHRPKELRCEPHAPGQLERMATRPRGVFDSEHLCTSVPYREAAIFVP